MTSHNSQITSIGRKFCVLAIIVLLSSCQRGSETVVAKTSHDTQYGYSAEVTDFTPDSVVISGNMRIETLDSLFICIENRSEHNIELADTGSIDCDTPPRKLFEIPLRSLCHPLVRRGERKELCIDLALRKTQYSSDTPYSFNASYSVRGESFPLTYNFRTPTMWRDSHGILSLQLDTIIDSLPTVP